MNRQDILQWIGVFESAWKEKEFSKLETLFSEVEEYWETPFGDYVSGWDNIKPLWDEIMFQSEIDLQIDILTIEDNKATLHWHLKYKDLRDSSIYEMDGTYFIVFNDKICKIFKQWWVMSE